MLVRHSAIYFSANVFSALFGFFNVFAFTRILSLELYGSYALGFSFAALLVTLFSTAVKYALLQKQARRDGTDVRGNCLGFLLLSCGAAPLGYVGARLVNLPPDIASASVLLALAITYFETTLELFRVGQNPSGFARGIIVRAMSVTTFGIASAFLSGRGAILVASSALAFTVATLTIWRGAWGSERPQFNKRSLLQIAKSGLPIALSLFLSGLSGNADRFLIAHYSGVAAAGQYSASADLVRQLLVIPAISIASAIGPLAVALHATGDVIALRSHLARGLELLMAVSLPACLGFALVSNELVNVILGLQFRQTAGEITCILAISLIFPIITAQYMHTSFLLANKNSYYVVNSLAILLVNLTAGFLFISKFGIMGAVWARVASDIAGFVVAYILTFRAFKMPFPIAAISRIGISVAWMAFVVRIVQWKTAFHHGPAVIAATVSSGFFAYALAVWVLNIAGIRASVLSFANQTRHRGRARRSVISR